MLRLTFHLVPGWQMAIHHLLVIFVTPVHLSPRLTLDRRSKLYRMLPYRRQLRIDKHLRDLH